MECHYVASIAAADAAANTASTDIVVVVTAKYFAHCSIMKKKNHPSKHRV